jgi:hypothetical protein
MLPKRVGLRLFQGVRAVGIVSGVMIGMNGEAGFNPDSPCAHGGEDRLVSIHLIDVVCTSPSVSAARLCFVARGAGLRCRTAH